MPIYEYRCRACGQQFEKLVRTFDPGEVSCLFCHSLNVERLLSSPLIRMGKSSEPTSEFTAKDAEVNYYKDKKDYDRAVKAAEKAGKSDWEVKDLYRKAGKKM
jgi:putative FmdB family regulatory protein